MNIADIKHMGLFQVDVLRIVTNLDNKAITDYTLKHREKWDRYTTYHDHELNKDWQLNLPERARLESAMIEAAHEFVKRTKRKPFEERPFLYYWCSVYDEGDQHGSHNHPNSLIAGTYYPSVGAKSSSIQLEAPWKSHIMHDNIPIGLFNYKPNPGDMLMWPSWIDHRVPIQEKSDTRRVAISFNLDYNKYHD
tara:strand:+ start:47 stop:625 length:579 start_codon:yes stop_codon:yes gene_type:complete